MQNCLTKILTDNKRLLETHVSHNHVSRFLWMILVNGRKKTYLDFLAAVCKCKDEALMDNQKVGADAENAPHSKCVRPSMLPRFRFDAPRCTCHGSKSPAGHIERRAPKSPKRRPQLTLNATHAERRAMAHRRRS